MRRGLLAATGAVAALALACATRARPVEPGEIVGRSYRNAALDLLVTLPPGWEFLSRQEIAAGTRAAKVDTDPVTILFTMVDRSHTPAAGRARRSVAVHAERLRDPPAGLTSEQLARQLEAALLDADTPIEIGIRQQAIVAGRRFVVVPTEMTRDGLRGRLDHHLRYEGGRLLVLTLSYPPEDGAPPPAAIEAFAPLAKPPPKGDP